ncbi:MAG: hypothetical protein KC550_00705 [Nanoarchaeota archaeon]|nr:hypothetical protein [Nanoarchaeota archaeon]
MTILACCRYSSNGLIIGTDRLVIKGGERLDSSKLIIKKNFIIGLMGNVISHSQLSEKNKFWIDLEKILDDNKDYDDLILTIDQYLACFNQGQRLIRDRIASFYKTINVDEPDYFHASFLFGIKFNDNLSTYYDLGLERGTISSRHPIIGNTLNGEFDIDISTQMFDKDDAKEYILSKIKIANEKFPDYCSGVEIVDFNLDETKVVYLQSIL